MGGGGGWWVGGWVATNFNVSSRQGFVEFGSSLIDIYLVLPGVELLTSNDLDIISARGEYLRAYPPAAQQLCMNNAPCHMFYGSNRYSIVRLDNLFGCIQLCR